MKAKIIAALLELIENEKFRWINILKPLIDSIQLISVTFVADFF